MAHAHARLTSGPLGRVEYIHADFDVLELIEPGVVAVSQWRPESGAHEDPAEIGLYCGVARKPAAP